MCSAFSGNALKLLFKVKIIHFYLCLCFFFYRAASKPKKRQRNPTWQWRWSTWDRDLEGRDRGRVRMSWRYCSRSMEGRISVSSKAWSPQEVRDVTPELFWSNGRKTNHDLTPLYCTQQSLGGLLVPISSTISGEHSFLSLETKRFPVPVQGLSNLRTSWELIASLREMSTHFFWGWLKWGTGLWWGSRKILKFSMVPERPSLLGWHLRPVAPLATTPGYQPWTRPWLSFNWESYHISALISSFAAELTQRTEHQKVDFSSATCCWTLAYFIFSSQGRNNLAPRLLHS